MVQVVVIVYWYKPKTWLSYTNKIKGGEKTGTQLSDHRLIKYSGEELIFYMCSFPPA